MKPLIYSIAVLLFALPFSNQVSGESKSAQKHPGNNPERFVDNHNGTVTDRNSGLTWIVDPHALPDNMLPHTWDESVQFCKNLNFAQCKDWRLPTVSELLTLVDYGHAESALPESNPFIGVPRSNAYWTSTTFALKKEQAWIVDLKYGAAEYTNSKSNSKCYVLPVRCAIRSCEQDAAVQPPPAPTQK
jgi:hypothetical protein